VPRRPTTPRTADTGSPQRLSGWIRCIRLEAIIVPLVPHLPSDEPEDEDAPDLDDVVDRILNRDDDRPMPTPTGA
jgi:hypothetical protein